MRLSRERGTRQAFTLIELLIVIAIIAVLTGLLVSAVTRVLAYQQRTETQSEITKMAQALEVARARYGNIPYLPSRLILYNDISKYRNKNALPFEKQSAAVLRSMFGRRFISNGNSVTWSPNPSVTLTGSECLVFYLGGMPQVSGATIRCTGFSDNPLNPTEIGGSRIGPFYEFRQTRLGIRTGGITFPEFADPYGTAYAFFGPWKENDYAPATVYSSGENTDCKHLGLNYSPPPDGLTDAFWEAGAASKKWLNPSTYQIISAGPDRRFGPGGAWDPVLGTTGAAKVHGSDDLANFSQSNLGDPQS